MSHPQYTTVKGCPDEVSAFVQRMLQSLSPKGSSDQDSASATYLRLASDDNMIGVWAALKKADAKREQRFSGLDWTLLLVHVHTAWFRSLGRSEFEFMTNQERERWLSDTRATVKKLRGLINSVKGGYLADDPGLHYPLEANGEPLIHFLRLLGVKYDSDADSNKRNAMLDMITKRAVASKAAKKRLERTVTRGPAADLRKRGIAVNTWEFDRARSALSFTIDDALRTFEAQLAAGVESAGPIRKPRDAKAWRAVFIYKVSQCLSEEFGLHIPDAPLADLCVVITEDDNITPSLVNRFRFRSARAKRLSAQS